MVSLSFAKAKYRVIQVTTCEIVWIMGLLKDFGFYHLQLALLFCDNMAIEKIVANSIFHERTKHMKLIVIM